MQPQLPRLPKSRSISSFGRVTLIMALTLLGSQSAGADDFVTVAVNPSLVLGTIHRDVLGINSDTRYDSVAVMAELGKTVAQIGIAGARWPGGTHADVFDWQSPTPRYCDSWSHQPTHTDGTFDAFMSTFVLPYHLDPELTVNYGTSNNCASAGDPAHAAAWVT